MLRKKKKETEEPVRVRTLSYTDLRKLVKEVERLNMGVDEASCQTDSIEIVFMSDGAIRVFADFVYPYDEELEIRGVCWHYRVKNFTKNACDTSYHGTMSNFGGGG